MVYTNKGVLDKISLDQKLRRLILHRCETTDKCFELTVRSASWEKGGGREGGASGVVIYSYIIMLDGQGGANWVKFLGP